MEEINKVIFLDMDGVVNSDELIEKWFDDKCKELSLKYQGYELRKKVREEFGVEFAHSTELIFPEFAQRITKICNETDCYIVWSSTWRKLDKYADIEAAKEMFNRNGLPGDRLIGYTPEIDQSWAGYCRGNEIALWIKNNTFGKIKKAAVIDDRIDAGYNLPDCAKYFNINEYIGIQDDDVKNIIDYLNDKEKKDNE